MTKSFYVGVNNTARKSKKAYVGVNGVARKVKKMYVGVNGVARLFFSSGKEVTYKGTETSLSDARYYMGSTTIGNYALFAGGTIDSNYNALSNVDAYNQSLTKSTPTSLSAAKLQLGAAAVGNYALFAGGLKTGSITPGYTTVDAYNTSLTRSTAPELTRKRSNSASNNSKYAMFGGGSSSYRELDAYDSSLTKNSTASFSSGDWYDNIGYSCGNEYAIFIDNGTTSSNSEVVAFNTSLTLTNCTKLTYYKYPDAGAMVGDYLVLLGNLNSDDKGVTAYHKTSLTQSILTPLSVGNYYCAGTSFGEYAIFAGGDDLDTTTIYDSSLTRSTLPGIGSVNTDLIQLTKLSAATVGNYAIFAGGQNWSTAESKAYVYQYV